MSILTMGSVWGWWHWQLCRVLGWTARKNTKRSWSDNPFIIEVTHTNSHFSWLQFSQSHLIPNLLPDLNVCNKYSVLWDLSTYHTSFSRQVLALSCEQKYDLIFFMNYGSKNGCESRLVSLLNLHVLCTVCITLPSSGHGKHISFQWFNDKIGV